MIRLLLLSALVMISEPFSRESLVNWLMAVGFYTGSMFSTCTFRLPPRYCSSRISTVASAWEAV